MFVPTQSTQRIVILLAVAIVLTGTALIVGGSTGSAAVPTLGDRTIVLGSWGADVFHLQQILVRMGYDIAADGHFGRSTQRAVIAFQLTYNLKPDGIVGPTTAATLLSLRPTQEYIVQPGDSLWAIAQRFDTTINRLVDVNNLSDGPLLVGTKLYVPADLQYTVQPGDSLSTIARRYGTTTSALARLNNITNPDLIRIGMTLQLPSVATLMDTGGWVQR